MFAAAWTVVRSHGVSECVLDSLALASDPWRPVQEFMEGIATVL